MNRCTVCGATSREGARFCTSCGARLVDENESSSVATADNDASTGSATPSDTAAQPIVAPSATTSETEPYESGDSPPSSTDDDHYASSWPGADSGTEDENKDVDATVTNAGMTDSDTASTAQDAEATSIPGDTSAWLASDETTTDDADVSSVPNAGTTGSDTASTTQDAEAASTPGDTSAWLASDETTTDDADDSESIVASAPATGTTRTGDVAGDNHHGASDWESWSPAPSAPASSGSAINDNFVKLHHLLDEMERRFERVTNPAELASRNLNPDDLADQLERWSRTVPDTDDLLESVRQVRRSPKDIDALRQLADHAADLELLVRHYQSITSTSEQWATDLRRSREQAADN